MEDHSNKIKQWLSKLTTQTYNIKPWWGNCWAPPPLTTNRWILLWDWLLFCLSFKKNILSYQYTMWTLKFPVVLHFQISRYHLQRLFEWSNEVCRKSLATCISHFNQLTSHCCLTIYIPFRQHSFWNHENDPC